MRYYERRALIVRPLPLSTKLSLVMRIPLLLFAFDTNKVQEYGFCEKTNYKVLKSGLQYKILHCSFLA